MQALEEIAHDQVRLVESWGPLAFAGGLVRGGRANQDDCAIGADNDLAAIADWLKQFESEGKSRHTERSYERECKRFYYWLVTHGPGELRSVKIEDVTAFTKYLRNPPIEEIEPRKKKDRLTHGDGSRVYYPFRGVLSKNSTGTALASVGSLFSHLKKARYLAYNAFEMSSGKIGRHRAAKVERFLPERLMTELLKTVSAMPERTVFDRTMRARADLIVKLGYISMARVGDLSGHLMSSFHYNPFDTKEGWWWAVTGKGNKPALIPVNDDAMAALATYRRLIGLPPQPNRREHIPILFSERGPTTGGRTMSESAIYRVVTDLAKATAKRLVTEGRDADAEILQRTTTHWLRHTGISHAVARGASLIDVMKTARHNDLNTTKLYMHTEDAERHRVMTDVMSLSRLKKS